MVEDFLGVVEHCPGDGGLPQVVVDDCPSW